MDAGKSDAAQTWLLLESLLTDLTHTEVPASPRTNLSPLPLTSPKLPHSASAPAAIPTVAQVLPEHPARSYSADGSGPYAEPGSRSGATPSSRHSSHKSRTYSSSTHSLASVDKGYLSPLRTTPVSSTTSSPRHSTTPLPSLSSSVSTAVLALGALGL